MMKSRVAVFGATGRMGSRVLGLVDSHYADRLEPVAGLGSSDDPAALGNADIVIDFSLPAGTTKLIEWLERNDGAPATVVSGTTGLSAEQSSRFAQLGRKRKVMHATNFSAGVAVLTSILEHAAPILAELGYTPVLTETHHRHKKDAPSGTALTLEKAMAPYIGVQTHSVRAGEIVGRHDLTFYSDHDRITIGHEALDRGLFARGAIDAAIWLDDLEQGAGSYDMRTYFRARFPVG